MPDWFFNTFLFLPFSFFSPLKNFFPQERALRAVRGASRITTGQIERGVISELDWSDGTSTGQIKWVVTSL